MPMEPEPVHLLLRRQRQLRLVPGEEVFVERPDPAPHVLQPRAPPLLCVPLPRVPAYPHRVQGQPARIRHAPRHRKREQPRHPLHHALRPAHHRRGQRVVELRAQVRGVVEHERARARHGERREERSLGDVRIVHHPGHLPGEDRDGEGQRRGPQRVVQQQGERVELELISQLAHQHHVASGARRGRERQHVPQGFEVQVPEPRDEPSHGRDPHRRLDPHRRNPLAKHVVQKHHKRRGAGLQDAVHGYVHQHERGHVEDQFQLEHRGYGEHALEVVHVELAELDDAEAAQGKDGEHGEDRLTGD
mmetsp:Transcript_2794/g.10977  ORF Transcript_2794/g.10977 Transcript_2794/m.10977 type:complete len:304 (+) Transcript_2794:1747-2658(+)